MMPATRSKAVSAPNQPRIILSPDWERSAGAAGRGPELLRGAGASWVTVAPQPGQRPVPGGTRDRHTAQGTATRLRGLAGSGADSTAAADALARARCRRHFFRLERLAARFLSRCREAVLGPPFAPAPPAPIHA